MRYTGLHIHYPKSTNGKSKGGGLCLIVHNTVRHRVLQLKWPNSDNHIEQQTVEIVNGENNNIKLINVKMPPESSYATGFTATLKHLLTLTDTLIVVDMNGHSQLWHSNLDEDRRGQLFSSEVDESNFMVLNEKKPTRVTKTTQSSPDISLAHWNLAMNIDWAVETALGSDHRPITLRLTCHITTTVTPYRKLINFKKADWKSFTEETERRFGKTKPFNTVHEAEKTFRRIFNKAVGRHIPQGCIQTILANFPTEAAELAKQRDPLQQ